MTKEIFVEKWFTYSTEEEKEQFKADLDKVIAEIIPREHFFEWGPNGCICKQCKPEP
jgi:hypothetical protein